MYNLADCLLNHLARTVQSAAALFDFIEEQGQSGVRISFQNVFQ
jgi:hypothetical protein